MEVIRKLGDRVEKEHDQYLRDSQRIEDRSATNVNGIATPPMGGTVDFESLVGGGGANTIKADTAVDSIGWEDDVWGSLLNDSQVSSPPNELLLYILKKLQPAPVLSPPTVAPSQPQQVQSLPSSPKTQTFSPAPSRPTLTSRSSRGLGATPAPASSFNSAAFSPPSQSRPTLGGLARSSVSTSSPLVPQTSQSLQAASTIASNGPYYNISMAPALVASSPQVLPSVPLQPTLHAQPMAPNLSTPSLFATSGMNVLAPSRPPQPTWPTSNGTSNKQLTKDDWGDFDPLA